MVQLKTYTIVLYLQIFQHAKFYPFRNVNLGFILKIFLNILDIVIKYVLI